MRVDFLYISEVKLLKRILVFFLCLQVSVPQHLQIDILRFPVLIGHFFEHEEHDESIGIVSFLAEHLSENIHKDREHSEHENLPFHHHSNDGGILQIQLAFFQNKIFSIFPITENSAKQESCYQANFVSHFYASIWQPPQLA